MRGEAWLITLGGSNVILEGLSRDLTTNDIRVARVEGAFYLESTALKALHDPGAVHELAQQLCRDLEDIVFAVSSVSTEITVARIGRKRGNGAVDQFVFPEPIAIRATALPPKVIVGSAPAESPEDRALRLHRVHPELVRARESAT
jgi:hypothetical protein